MTDIDSLLHSDNFSEIECERLKDLLDSWANIRGNTTFLKIQIQKLVNKIIRKQNEIHIKVEQKRPWMNTTYVVENIDFLNNGVIRAYIKSDQPIITGEKVPLINFDIERELLDKAYDPEVLSKYLKSYEANLVQTHELKKRDAQILAAQQLRSDFEYAKEFYLKHKEHFEKLDAENEAKVLPFEKWKESIKNGDVDYIMSWQDAEDRQETLNRIGLNVKLDDELEAMLRHEYERYVQRVKMGIE